MKKTLVVWWMSFSVGCACGAANALAQAGDRKMTTPENDRNLPAPEKDPWQLSLTAAAHYDDNRDAIKSNAVSNLDLILRPRAALMYNLDATFLSLFYEPSYTWHSNPRTIEDGNPQHREEWFQLAGIDVARQISPLVGIKVGDAFAYTDDPNITEGGVAVRQNDTYIGNRAYGSIDLTPSRATYVRLDGAYSLKRYDEQVIADDQNEDVIESFATAGYTLVPGMSAFGQFGCEMFDNANTNWDRGATAYTFAGGLEKVFNPDFSGRITAGYQQADYSDSILGSKNGWLTRLEGTLGGSCSTRLRLLAEHGYYMPYVRPYSIQEMLTFRATVDHDVTRDLMLSVFGQYTDSDYPSEQSPTENLDLPGGHDRMTDIGLSATYRITRSFSCRAGYRFQNWDSDVRESYSHNMIDVSITGQL